MSKPINDGGAAFPFWKPTNVDSSDGWHGGMSLRAWLAGQALAGWLASYVNVDRHPGANSEFSHNVAEYSVAIADAVLAELSKPLPVQMKPDVTLETETASGQS